MGAAKLRWPAGTLVSLLAALATWVTLLSWSGLAERPSIYLVPLLFACLLVALVGIACRAVRMPAPLVLLVQVVVVAFWLHARWTGTSAHAGVLPSVASVREALDTLAAAAEAARAYAAPVPRSVPEFGELMLASGAATALLVDFLASGVRRVPLAGLPLLAAYTAPVSVLDQDISWAGFAAAAGCFVALLAADEAERLARWGRQLSSSTQVFDSQAVQPGGAALWSSARKIGVTATGLAVLVPIVVPTLSINLFAGNGPGSGGDGAGVSMSNPMVGLKRDLTRGADVDLVRVVTPERNPGYLRISVLDQFDGESWRPSGRDIPVSQRAEGLVPRPPGLDTAVPRARVPYTIQVSDEFKSTWLPTPYPVFSISAPGDWRYDRSTLDFVSAADGQTTEGLVYDLEALQVEPTAEQLADSGPAPSSVSAPNTALPRNLPVRIRLLARTVTAGLPTKLQKAARLQEWFRVDGGFTYSLDRAPGTGMETLMRFLDNAPGGRVGYCEQFAAAMALMGRAIGIPSRVAVGFLRPSPAGPDTYVYSSHDLHAWPEMYFEGVGWVRFEPTPQARTGEGLPSYTTEQLPGAEPSSSASGPSARPTLPDRLDRTLDPALAGGDSSGGNSGRGDFVAGLLFVLLVALLLATPRLLRSAIRERRWAGARGRGQSPAPEAAWSELRDSAHDLGLGWDDRITVRRQARTLARAFGRVGDRPDALGRSETRGAAADPTATEALDRLVEQLERTRYARQPAAGAAGSGPTGDDLRADVERCVDALEAGASKRQRTRATWFPASLTNRWRGRTTPTYAGQAGVDHAV